MSLSKREKILKSFKPESLARFNVIDYKEEGPVDWSQFKEDDLVITYKEGKITSYFVIGKDGSRFGALIWV